jgi:hypothetical protein
VQDATNLQLEFGAKSNPIARVKSLIAKHFKSFVINSVRIFCNLLILKAIPGVQSPEVAPGTFDRVTSISMVIETV